MKDKFLAIEGNIGAGKTSLVEKLAAEYPLHDVYEAFENNPFLSKFYDDPTKHALALEIYFLTERHKQLKGLAQLLTDRNQTLISDYFAMKSLLFAQVNLNKEELEVFNRLFSLVKHEIPQPDKTVYLYNTIPNLRENIIKRGRPYEMNISNDYLEKVQQSYLNYFDKQKDQTVLIVNTADLNFMESGDDYSVLKDWIASTYPTGTHRLGF